MKLFNILFVVAFGLFNFRAITQDQSADAAQEMKDLPDESAGGNAGVDGAQVDDKAPDLNSPPNDTSASANADDPMFSDEDKMQTPDALSENEKAPVTNNESSKISTQELIVEKESGAYKNLGVSDIKDPQEPGSNLEASEKFYRVPLKPPMSDRGWTKWAGRGIDKIYKVRTGDTLWSVSDRLFGNPHIWPKIWQLNSRIFNAHTIPPGLELMFTPGNPYAAPIFAFKNVHQFESEDKVPLTGHLKENSILDKIRDAFGGEYSGPAQFRNFLIHKKPEILARLLKQKTEKQQLILGEGSQFSFPELVAGQYAIVRLETLRAHGSKVVALNWLGRLEVSPYDPEKNPLNAVIDKAFEEIFPGDLIVKREFAMNPIALHNEVLGSDRQDEVKLFPLDESFRTIIGENTLMGAKFKNTIAGPQLGAIVNLVREHQKVATAVLIDRQENVGTFWVVDSKTDLSENDKIE
jgi:hypothetical protein